MAIQHRGGEGRARATVRYSAADSRRPQFSAVRHSLPTSQRPLRVTMPKRLLFLVSAAIVAAASLTSCSNPESKIPTAPGLPGFLSAEIVGPANVPPGQSVQFTANARFGDG